jgi:predicted component of type VI protein secretion system
MALNVTLVIHLGAYDKKKVGEKCKIGRHGNADYQLSFRDRTREIYMTISRVHTEIILTEMGWVAKDNSENGTFVNQLLLNQDEVDYATDYSLGSLVNDNWHRLANGGHLLKHGDVLSLGTAPSKIKGYVFYFFDLGG